MTNDRARLIFHGAVVILVGLLCGYPTVVEALGSPSRNWHTAHEGLIMMGIWMLAMSSVLPALVLKRREALGLLWSMLAVGYGFMTALIIQGVTGYEAFEPGQTPVSFVEFTGSAIGILGSLLTALLTLSGARAAIKAGRQE